MCIISIKAKGINIPTEEVFHNMWRSNSDGAGFMYAVNDKVYIKKGFMKFSDFEKAIEELPAHLGVENLTDIPMIYHFRIGTAGGNIASNTHPFPVTENISLLQKLALSTDVGVAHNGIIRSVTPRSGISDTMEYIATQMALLKRMNNRFYTNKAARILMSNAVESKLAFLDKNGKIYTIGEFETDKETGLVYSNSTYKTYRYAGKYNGCWDWDDENSIYEYWKKKYGDTDLIDTNLPEKATIGTKETIALDEPSKVFGTWGLGEVKDLVWLDCDEHYLRDNDTGDLFNVDIEEYAMDDNGRVYFVDVVNEIAVEYKTFEALNTSGGNVKYCEEREFSIECVSWATYYEIFGEDEYIERKIMKKIKENFKNEY